MPPKERRAVGCADCVICCCEFPGADAPGILQIIEGLAYHRHDRTVEICFLFVYDAETVRNDVRFWVVHRGAVRAAIEPFIWARQDARLETIKRLYADRIVPTIGDLESALFYERLNCIGVSPEHKALSLLGPGSCFAGVKAPISLEAEPAGSKAARAFSSFLIPPKSCSPIRPGERGLFVLKLDIPRESYDRFIGPQERFSVDSWPRLRRGIEIDDLRDASPAEHRFHDELIRPDNCLVKPVAYDIIIFQKLGDPVRVDSGSLSIMPVRPADAYLEEQVLWFFGQPQEFYLELGYADRPAEKHLGSPHFVVRQDNLADPLAAQVESLSKDS